MGDIAEDPLDDLSTICFKPMQPRLIPELEPSRKVPAVGTLYKLSGTGTALPHFYREKSVCTNLNNPTDGNVFMYSVIEGVVTVDYFLIFINK
jgi:hypothetical protein